LLIGWRLLGLFLFAVDLVVAVEDLVGWGSMHVWLLKEGLNMIIDWREWPVEWSCGWDGTWFTRTCLTGLERAATRLALRAFIRFTATIGDWARTLSSLA
jgi:hypothetical protein